MTYLPYRVVDDFEKEVAEFAGSKYAVAIDSCSNALFLCCYYTLQLWGIGDTIQIPSHTYFSVPCSIIHAGGKVVFDNYKWSGRYKLRGTNIWDSALRFRRNMYIKDSFYCISFHAKKHLPIGRGGMILLDDKKAYEWFKKARIDGRSEMAMHLDKVDMIGWNCYMQPEQAARGLLLLQELKKKKFIPDIKNNYPDLSKLCIYQQQ